MDIGKLLTIVFFVFFTTSCRKDFSVKDNTPYTSLSIEQADELGVLITVFETVPKNLSFVGDEKVPVNAWIEYEWMIDSKTKRNVRTNDINFVLDIDIDDYENYILSKSPTKIVMPFNDMGIRNNVYYNVNNVVVPNQFALYLLKLNGEITNPKIESSMKIEFIKQ